MQFPNRPRLTLLRAAAAGLLAYGLLMPASIHAAPASSPATGALVGRVTCGDNLETPAANVLIAVEGIDLTTHTDNAGNFTLTGVPAAKGFTIDAVANPDVSFVTSRIDVVVQPGEMLDIGILDLPVCSQQLAPAPPQDTEAQHENNLDQ